MKFRILFAILIPFFAAAMQWVLWEHWIKPYAWFLFFPTSFLCARLAGLQGGLIGTCISALLVWYFFIPLQLSFQLQYRSELASILLFIVMGSLFAWFFERLTQTITAKEKALAEVREANRTISELYKKTKEIDELKSQFFANVSHELRTPLTLIMAPLERRLAFQGCSEHELRETDMMLRNARLLYRHVTDLLDIAKFDAGQMKIHWTRIDLAYIVRVMASHFESLAYDKQIDYRIQASQQLPMIADKEKLERIVLNLLSNAFKFTPDGGRIELNLSTQQGHAILKVQDNGPGVPIEFREAIFERFRQVEGSSHRQFGGTGLGLAIVKDFIQMHDGVISVTEASGGGALFTVSLPIHASSDTELNETVNSDSILHDQLIEEISPQTAQLNHQISDVDESAPQVLIVEDNPDMNHYICDILRPHYRVIQAFNGSAGLYKARQFLPELILSDIMMPILDGNELIAALHNDPATSEIPVIVLTAKADDALRIQLLKNGVQDYLQKPFNTQELLARVNELIMSRRRSAEQLRYSEIRFETTFDQAAVGFALVTPDGGFLRVNRKLCEILGYSAEELLQLKFQDITFPDDLEKSIQSLQDLLTNQYQQFVAEKRYIRKNGDSIWANLSVALVRNNNGEPDYMVSVIEDIQTRKDLEASVAEQTRHLKRVQEDLVASEQKLRSIFEETNDAIISKDMQGIITSWNPAATTIFGYTADEALGKSVTMLFPPEHLHEEQILLEHILNGERIGHFETELIRKDGKKIVISATLSPIRDATGRITGAAKIARDISERIRLENGLRASEKTYRSLFENMLNGFAHCQMLFENGKPEDFIYLTVNHAFENLTGLHNVAGKRVSEVIPNITKSDPQLFEIYGRVASTGQPERFEIFLAALKMWFSVSVYCPELSHFVTVFDVITERKLAEQEIKNALEKAERFRKALDYVPAYVYMKDLNHAYLYANRPTLELFQCSLEELQICHDSQFFQESTATLIKSIDARVFKGETTEEEIDVLNIHGERRVYWEAKTPLWADDTRKDIVGLIGISTDITRRKLDEEHLRLAASVFANTHDGIMITNRDASILDVNPAFSRITGFPREKALGQNPSILKSGHQNEAFYKALWQQLRENGVWSGEIWNRKLDGTLYPEWLTISAINDAAGETTHYIGSFADISLLKQHEQELVRMAYYDSLTGIPNRVMLADRMLQAIAYSLRHDSLFAIAYLDLDEFKTINDGFGHEQGDFLLKTMVERIRSVLREGDTLARLGGDEFAILLIDLTQVDDCFNLLRRIMVQVNTPVTLSTGSSPLHISASIGVTFFPQDNANPDILLRHADQAMYQAKQSGRNRFHVYDLEYDLHLQSHQAALKEIETALANNEFRLYYQPKVDLQTGSLIGAEALIRWQHPQKGLLAPVLFLPIIENTELEYKVGNWVIETALTQLEQWYLDRCPMTVSINISGDHLQQTDFVETLRFCLLQHPALPRGHLEIEILETIALKDFDRVIKTMEACQRLGISFALDDFGTGYSSLTYLRNLPAEIIKIDQSFVRDMLEDEGDHAIVQGILALTETFKRKAVAEGIETDAHFQVLKALGCHYGQGYQIAKPMPAEDYHRWCQQRTIQS